MNYIKLIQNPKFTLLITSPLGFLILLKAVDSLGLILATIISVGFAGALLLTQLPSSKSVPWLIGFAIMPFDSFYPSIPFLSKFNSSAPYILILGGSLLLIGKTRKAQQSSFARLSLAPIIFLVPVLIALIIRPQQIPRNMIFLAATIFFLLTLKNYVILSKFNPVNLVVPIARSIGAYSILMLIFKNPVSLIISGNYVNKLDGKANPGRLTGFGNDYEILGLSLALGAVACFYLITMPNPPHKFVYSVLFGTIWVSLLATASIASMLLAFFGIVLVMLNPKRELEMQSKRGHKMIIFVTCFFVFAATQVAARRFLQRGIEFTNFLETDGSLTRVINREQVWSIILTSTAWDKGAIIGQGWPYPYELFATWPHNTFLGFWVAGGLPLLLVSLVFFGKSLQLIVSRFKSRDAVMGIFALMLILGSITIDLYRTSSMIFLTFTIFSLLYWETQKQPLQ